ncbi:YbhN family protein [Streptomyces sp. NPDC046985]|uniref:lysylphosphatidylglycerol synthase transmembrane domain-containing protein n=1 Tax=Streptomyces sp. NPDC046985 TaxID=3155377 RepID=UPI0033C857B8
MTRGPRKNRRRMLHFVRTTLYTGIVVFLCWQVWRMRDGLYGGISSVGWKAVGCATVFTVLANFPGFFGWRALASGSGVRLGFSDAAWIFFVSGVTRYLPGAIWPTVTQAALARKVGAPPSTLMATGLVSQILTMLSGVTVGLLALPSLVAADARWWLLLPVLLSAGVPMFAPRLLERLIGLGQRVLRSQDHRIALPPRRASAAMIALSGLGWCCSGLHAAILAIALGAHPLAAMTLGVGGFTLSAVAGALSLAPGGIGVREAVLGLTLGVLISGPSLVTLLLLSRILTVLGHAVATLGVLGCLMGKRALQRRRDERETPPDAPPEAPEAAVALEADLRRHGERPEETESAGASRLTHTSSTKGSGTCASS